MTVILLIYLYLIPLIIRTAFSDVYVYNDHNKIIDDFEDQRASFGPLLPMKGIIGYVTLTDPVNACTKVAPPPHVSMSTYGWIALIPRTNTADKCDFDLKVLNAQNANFTAVIIYNYDDTLITMGTHGRDIKISSTLITHSDGLSIIKYYLYNKTSNGQFHIKITTERLFQFGAYLIPFIVIVSVSFLTLICFALVKCYLNRRRSRRHRLPRSALKQLPIKKFVKGDRWEVCAICLDDFEDGVKLRILPCDHAYHVKCIDPWLLNNRRQCPICKRYVFPSHDDSDDETNPSTTTERTPLIQPVNDNPSPILSTNRETERRIVNSYGADHPNSTNIIHEPSITDNDIGSSPLSQTTSNHITTTADLVFDRPLSDSSSSFYTQLTHITTSQSNSSETDNDTIATTYASLHEPSSSLFTTSLAGHFFVGSTTDTIDISAIEDGNEIKTDGRNHSVTTDVETNGAYVTDDETFLTNF